MRLAGREFYRIFGRKWVLLWFLLLLGLGLWVSGLWTEQQFQKSGTSLESYLEMAEQYEGMPLAQAAELLEARHEEVWRIITFILSYRTGTLSEGEVTQVLKDLGYPETDITALDDRELSSVRINAGLVLKEVTALSTYDDRLKELKQGSSGLSGISLFAEAPYVVRLREKTMRDYSSLSVSVDSWHHNTAARLFLQNRVMDGFGFLFLLTVLLLMFTDEREKGYTMLISTTKRGREKFWFGKSAVLFGCTAVVTIVYEGVLLWYYMGRAGDVTWGLPVQSLVEFGVCRLKLMIWQAVLFTVLLKILLIYLILLAIAALACVAKKNVNLLGGAAAASLLLALWMQNSGVNSRAGWLTSLNPLLFSNGAELLLGYQSFSFFGYPVDRVWIVFWASILVLVLANIAGSRLYGKALRTVPWRFPLGKAKQMKSKAAEKWHVRRAPLFILELKKLLLSGSLLLPVLGISLLGIGYYLTRPEIALSAEERYYEEYMRQMNGPLTDEKEQFLEKERIFFAGLEELQLFLQEQNDVVLQNYIEGMLVKKAAFEQVEEQYKRIAERNPDGVFLYEKGYLYLLGVNHNEQSDRGVLVIGVIFTIFLPCFVWVEYRKGAAELVRTTARGRRRLKAVQYGVYFLLTGVMVSCIYGGDTVRFLRQFGSYGLNQKLNNLEMFSHVLSGHSMGAALLFIWLLRLMGAALAVYIVMSVMYVFKDYLKTVLTCSIVIVLPCFLSLLGFSFLKGYFLNALIWGNEILLLWKDGRVGTLLAIVLQGGICLCVCSTMMRKEAKRR